MKERAWGEPIPCGEQLPARGLPAATAWGLWGPAPAQQCWQHWSCCSRSVPVSPSAVARFCCSSFSLRRVPEPRLSPAGVLSQVLSGSITAHVVFMAASSLRWGFAGLAWLLSRLQCGMAAGSGRLFSAAHMENTLSNHKEWRWHLKKTQIKVVSRGLTGWRRRSCLA